MPMACFKHHARHCDFRRGKKLGLAIILSSGSVQQCPQSMSAADFAALPASSGEVHLLLQQPGFRPKEIILVTTLVDSKRYSQARLAQLYQLRWQATEVNFKHLNLEDGDDFENSWNGAQGNLGAFACVQLAKLDVAISPARVPPCGFPCRGLDNSSISSDLIWLRQLPKPSSPLTTLLDVISAHLVPLRP